jgi:uncharacterized membrane protein YdjX (TVP38/TMEM64 family)
MDPKRSTAPTPSAPEDDGSSGGDGGGVWARLRPLLLVLALIAVPVVLYRFLPVGEWLGAVQHQAASLGPAGWFLYAGVYALCVVLLVPASVLTLGAGAIYGLAIGVPVVLAGASLGATGAFLLARTGLRGRVQHMAERNPRFAALDRAIAREGARIVFLVRLAPIFPFTYVNYAFGLTGVGAVGYVAATVVGMIPGTVAYVYLGAAAGAAATPRGDLAQTAIQVVGAVAALLVTVVVARVASKAIREAGVAEEMED